MRALLIMAAFLLAVAGTVLGVDMAIGSLACSQRWPDRVTKYGALGGCLVQIKSGEFVPERALRVANGEQP